MRCLLHEKPFAGVNGSGKHNNWSLTTDDGINLLEPGKTPHENIQFLLVLTCILKAVDEHADLLRESAADVGNDERLGGNEAPPAVISVFLGEQDLAGLTVCGGTCADQLLQNILQLLSKKYGNHCRRCLMAAKSLVISHICRRFTQKICMFIYCFQDTGEDQKELNIFMRCFARIQKIDSVICGKRPDDDAYP